MYYIKSITFRAVI